jgi:PTS system mannose-specific IID component
MMAENEKKLSKSALFKSWRTWFFFNGSSQSGVKMQGIAFAHSMLPIIRELYHKDDEIRDALKRHVTLFNVEPQVGTLINGVAAAMEEQRANGADLDDDSINTVKVALMGPMSGIGDTIVPGTIIPILLAISIGITNSAGLIGPLFYFIVYPIALGIISWYLYKFGYKQGVNGIQGVLAGGRINSLTDSLNVLGLLVMGALSASYITLSTPLQYTSGKMVLKLQDIFDKIVPGILPLLLVTFSWLLLSKFKISPLTLMLFIFLFALVGVAIRVF